MATRRIVGRLREALAVLVVGTFLLAALAWCFGFGQLVHPEAPMAFEPSEYDSLLCGGPILVVVVYAIFAILGRVEAALPADPDDESRHSPDAPPPV